MGQKEGIERLRSRQRTVVVLVPRNREAAGRKYVSRIRFRWCLFRATARSSQCEATSRHNSVADNAYRSQSSL